ncbi:MAG: acyl-CoA thioesterase [Myxococcota bacterium]
MRELTTQLRVRYAETDAWGVTYHSNFIIYFEVGRNEFNRDLQLDWRAIEATGVSMVVAEAHVKYTAPAKYDDLLTICTGVAKLGNRSIRFEYRILRGEELLCTGWTAHVFVDRVGKPVLVPEAFREVLRVHDLLPVIESPTET